ncbi:MAG: DUF4838 domain-containing protein [Verrucomicrobiales bacterium]|nr:DUF4838 domain-containing protein [Verrucomicrobiales bacterium]
MRLPLFLGLCLLSPALRAVEMVREGHPACTLVLAESPTPSARLAALEIRSHVLKTTGADLPVRTDAGSVSGPRILVGESRATQALGLRAGDFAPQEYLVAFRPDTVVLLGRDWEDTPEHRREDGRTTGGESLAETRHRIDYAAAVGLPSLATGVIELPGLFDDQGTCLATYDFLERLCGVRWYGPSTTNEVVPSRTSLHVDGPDVRRSPALKHRSALPGGNWPFLKGQWGTFTREQVHLFWRRSRQGGERWAGNHTFHRETLKHAFQNPEYQCQNPRGLGSQLCYSNPKLVAEVAQAARDFFDGKGTLPVGWKGAGNYFALVPDDNMNLCTCPDCQALLKPGAGLKTGQFASAEMSAYWFSFVNAVARELRKTHPDKFIATLAYWAYTLPPNFPMEPNVSVSPCLQTCYYPVHTGVRDLEMKAFRDWSAVSSGPRYLWVYYHHPMEPALIDHWKCFPHVMVHETAQLMRTFIREGVRGIYECGEQDQLEQYVMARVWDDPDTDVDAVIDEFFRLYFGAAGPSMKAFYLRLEQVATDPAHFAPPYRKAGGIEWRKAAWETLGTAEQMEYLGTRMDTAARQAQTPLEQQRVALWRAALWDWMVAGREQALAAKRSAAP